LFAKRQITRRLTAAQTTCLLPDCTLSAQIGYPDDEMRSRNQMKLIMENGKGRAELRLSKNFLLFSAITTLVVAKIIRIS
jgi:hypothetical protein